MKFPQLEKVQALLDKVATHLPMSPLRARPMALTPIQAIRGVIALGFVMVVVLLSYWPAASLPIMSEGIVEQQLAEVSPTHYLLRSAYGEEGSGIYYRFGTRFIDHMVQQLAGGPDRITDFFNQTWQILIHVLCSALLFLLIFQQTGSRLLGAFLGALLFALHPSITAAVVYVSVRWNTSILVTFLIIANVYEYALRPAQKSPPRILLYIMPLPVLFLAMIAEIGVVAMACLGIWLLYRCVQRGKVEWLIHCMLPLAPVPFIYLALRRVALGTMTGSYVEGPSGMLPWLYSILSNIVYDATVLINPLQFSILTITPRSASSVLLAVFIILGVLTGLLLLRPIRRFLLENPMPTIGLTCFFLFQFKALWLIIKEPIGLAGIDRGYVYYWAVALLGLLLGNGIARIIEAAKSPVTRFITVAATIWLIISGAGLVRDSVSLWRDGGAILRHHEAQLRPILSELPEGSQIFTRNFPEMIHEPYLPWVMVYYYTQPGFMHFWGGKWFDVYSDYRNSSPPPGFDGWIFTNVDGEIQVTRVSQDAILQRFLDHQRMLPEPMPTLQPFANGLEAAQPIWKNDLEVESDEAGILQLRATGTDPWVAKPVGLRALDYGMVSFEIRFPDPSTPRGTQYSQLYYRAAGASFDEYHSIIREVEPSTDWQRVEFPLFDRANWQELEQIDSLRFDFIAERGPFEVRNVTIAPGLQEALDADVQE